MHVKPNLAERLENNPNWNTEWVFLNKKAEMLSNNSSKTTNWPIPSA